MGYHIVRYNSIVHYIVQCITIYHASHLTTAYQLERNLQWRDQRFSGAQKGLPISNLNISTFEKFGNLQILEVGKCEIETYKIRILQGGPPPPYLPSYPPAYQRT